MLRGYIRERKKGPSIDEQKAALKAAGVEFDGTHPPVYIDMVGKRGQEQIPQLAAAINSLRVGDTLVVYDQATIGLTEAGLWDAYAAVAQRLAILKLADGTVYEYTPEAAILIGLIADGMKILAREKARTRNDSSPNLGRPRKLDGDALVLARELWGKKDMTSRQVAAAVLDRTKVDISIRTLIKSLGHKTEAVAREQRKLR